MTDNTDQLEPGKEVYIRAKIAFNGVVDSLITCKNDNGYYYTVPRTDIAVKEYGHWNNGVCSECHTKSKKETLFCQQCGAEMKLENLEKKGSEHGEVTEG